MIKVVKLEKWTSDTTPSNIFDSIYKVSSLESYPKFWGKVSFNWLYKRSKYVKDDRFPKDTGFDPEIELFQRESCTSFLNYPSTSLKWPESWAWSNYKISRQYNPDNLSKILNISWLQLLYDKSILMADVRFPMALEIVPCKLLEPRLRNSRWLKPYNQLGIEELKDFQNRSRCLREVMLGRSTGIEPWKLDRSRETRLRRPKIQIGS